MAPEVSRSSVKMKVCLVGEEGVGKTSLIRRYVFSQFDEKYMRTVGTMVSKKTLTVGPVRDITYDVNLLVWDIMGRRDFMSLYKEAYFSHARGMLAVCDLTRPETLEALEEWIYGIRSSVGEVPLIVLANKKDMRDYVRTEETALAEACKEFKAPYMLTSAKTGENVEAAFQTIADDAVRWLPREAPPPPSESTDETAS